MTFLPSFYVIHTDDAQEIVMSYWDVFHVKQRNSFPMWKYLYTKIFFFFFCSSAGRLASSQFKIFNLETLKMKDGR